jgi:hypothetical protein
MPPGQLSSEPIDFATLIFLPYCVRNDEEADAAILRHGHRQACQLWRGKAGVMPGIEHRQHRDLTTERKIRTSQRADESGNEAVQIGRSGAALPLSPRSDHQRPSSPPRSRHRRCAQSFQDPDISGLGGNLQHWLRMDSECPFAIACIRLTRPRQVDGAPATLRCLRWWTAKANYCKFRDEGVPSC